MAKYNKFGNNRLGGENSMSQMLDVVLKKYKLTGKLDKLHVIETWDKLVGVGIKNYILDVDFNRDTLYVSFNSAIVREELSYSKTKIIDMINADLGKDVVKNLILR